MSTINNRQIHFQRFQICELENLLHYLYHLSPESKKRFGPHAFTKEAIQELIADDSYRLFVAINQENKEIVAYTIIKMGWLDFEYPRLGSYGLQPENGDCTLAPSVADEWQGKGLGSRFLEYVIQQLKENEGIKRVFLWGGVQSDNEKAVRLYQKFGFRTLGQFEYNGWNWDMVLD